MDINYIPIFQSVFKESGKQRGKKPRCFPI